MLHLPCQLSSCHRLGARRPLEGMQVQGSDLRGQHNPPIWSGPNSHCLHTAQLVLMQRAKKHRGATHSWQAAAAVAARAVTQNVAAGLHQEGGHQQRQRCYPCARTEITLVRHTKDRNSDPDHILYSTPARRVLLGQMSTCAFCSACPTTKTAPAHIPR